jgi:predicted dehydrogenase
MKQWKIAQIGCGAMAAKHAEQISELPEAVMAVAADLNAEKAKNFADRFKFARSSSRWEDILDDKTIDIVIVATYSDTHHAICKALLENGKHVICEKPGKSFGWGLCNGSIMPC